MSREEEIRNELLDALQNLYGCLQVSEYGEDYILLTDDEDEQCDKNVYKIRITKVI